MNLGFLTNCLETPFQEKVQFANKVGFDGLEVACWQKQDGKLHSGCDIDVSNFNMQEAAKVKRIFHSNQLEISSLAYYDNMLHPDFTERDNKLIHLRKVILAAEMLGVELVGTYIGKNPEISIDKNFDLFEQIFVPLVCFAERHHVKIMIENCPMPSWSDEGLPSTISYSPEFWDEMFKRIPSPNFGLNFDPSHLYWMQIDYLDCAEKYAKRIFHMHANDLQLNKGVVPFYSIYGKKINKLDYRDMGWYTPKAPGLGEIKWKDLISVLKKNGYDGYISIEYKDNILSGETCLVKKGLQYSYDQLRPLI